ncbi:UDP-2,4-diacetamido-2,4,6-trideoxy-beta-L-altropyranose hydrolase [Gracilibacillus marinus]|uniref:UDP-2,4-diacetamido-2,4, 6-trideoxy-beta-L-altropyranose hydrolase n=1 Tax=Gracilibacillus marinus TaxID=630535 RepID=A0ABV8VUW6_9BACI
MRTIVVVIRVDASVTIGTGHVMRCLVLADDLSEHGVDVLFICRKTKGNLISIMESKGYKVKTVGLDIEARETIAILQTIVSIDLLIIDHYGIDEQWEKRVRPYVKKLMVIDDLANRPHCCDLLLDQNELPNKEERYAHLVPTTTEKLLGLHYLLLRKEFRDFPGRKKSVHSISNVLVSFGGSDPTNETMKVMQAIHRLDVSIVVVVGSSYPYYQQLVQQYLEWDKIIILKQTSNMAEWMRKADIAIGAGGTSTWERVYMELPTITIDIADNQTEILRHTSKLGIISHMGKSDEVTTTAIANRITEMQRDKEIVNKLMRNMKEIKKQINPNGVCEHILNSI